MLCLPSIHIKDLTLAKPFFILGLSYSPVPSSAILSGSGLRFPA